MQQVDRRRLDRTLGYPMILVGLFACILVPGTVRGGEEEDDFGHRMTFFYLAPTEAGFAALQDAAEQRREELVGEGGGVGMLVCVMIARVSQKHGWQIKDNFLGRKAQELIANETEFARYVNDDRMVDPGKLDIWWVSYFATGETKYLDKIYRFAGLKPDKEEMGQMLVVGAASWSFRSNCRQHPSVMEYAKGKLAGAEGEKLEFLKKCVAVEEEDGERVP
jgi:hypothetical protein